MFNTIRKHIKDGNVFTGVEYLSEHDIHKLFCVQLSKKKNELHLINTCKTETVEELSLQLKKNHPLFITINTSQVISKFVAAKTDNELAIVHKAFPNIDLDDFYYEISSIKNNSLISICRKEQVDTVLAAFIAKKMEIIGFSLAFHQIYQVEKFIDDDIIFSNKVLVKNEDTVFTDAKNADAVYNINGIEVQSDFILSFSAALTHFLNGPVLGSNFRERIITLKNEFYQKRFFHLFSKSFGMILLGVLLINFFFFNHYFQKVEELKQTIAINSSNKEKLLKLDEVVSKKEKLVNDIISSSSSRSSMYLDQTASLLPETLLLTGMNYQPIQKKIKKDKPILFETDVLEIEGHARDSGDFSEWIETIEKLKWVSELSVEGYGYENSSTSSFKVVISIENEQ
ncbi:hypothetical protein GTQ40_13730 [Flavobacteriaceae bacterium R38]|nr:hypothetical protein [Flavobacteriaceae bacterium R38]